MGDAEQTTLSLIHTGEAVLKDVSFTAKQGEVTALVDSSGGERQRISIARAFLKNAPIILLDEAAAHGVKLTRKMPPSPTVCFFCYKSKVDTAQLIYASPRSRTMIQ